MPWRVLVPNLITGLNVAFGFVSVSRLLAGDIRGAAMFILFANFLDLLDGRVAKALHGTSAFGAQFDSLADLVTFGVAPSLLIYRVYFAQWGSPGVIVGAIPMMAVAIRLARFNAQHGAGENEFFSGLPTPSAATLLAGYVVFTQDIWGKPSFPGVALALVGLSAVLMLSNVPYETDRVLRPSRILRTWKGVTYLVSVITVLVVPAKAFFFWAIAFITFGLGRQAWRYASGASTRRRISLT